MSAQARDPRPADDPHRATRTRPDGPAAQARRSASSCLQSNLLLQGQSSVDIQHNGTIYRLQATKLGKLILTK